VTTVYNSRQMRIRLQIQ